MPPSPPIEINIHCIHIIHQLGMAEDLRDEFIMLTSGVFFQ